MQLKETSCFDVSTEQLLMNLFTYLYTIHLLMFILVEKKLYKFRYSSALADPGGSHGVLTPLKSVGAPKLDRGDYRLYSMQFDKITFLLILLLQNVKI